ncbi:MAG: DegT/DnrJ/EryC1/StrS family aminotransferase, partial [Steroidobacteraceae bacterium]
RMTDVQAALGASQLERLASNVERRNALARRYDRSFQKLPLQLPTVTSPNKCAFHLYVIRLRRRAAPLSHRELFDGLRERGIRVNLHYLPVHLQPYYRTLGFRSGQFPEAEAHGEEAITLPLFASLSDEEQDRVIAAVGELLGA